MSTIFAKPESALRRAEELIHVGQKQAALEALHDLITSRRCRSWQKPLEKAMMRYVELCVDLRKGRFAKDGLIQYSRIVCQQQLNNVSSLEEVVKHFMHLSSKKAEEAAMDHQAQALDVHDLEAPEDLMLSYVSGKDWSESDTPYLKFLWETYRTVLEVLRNNSKLEALYAMAAHKAFQFCKQYKRSAEFRRLCEMIRNHLANLNRSYRDRPDLTAPESCQLYLDTRVEQLKIAAELSLSQEAFRSVEDIHGLMSMVQRTPKPSVLAVYYAKLTEIFWTSESHYLYHAYARLELFNLHKCHNKNLTRKDLQLLASSALLAALSVTPYYDHESGLSHLELENEKGRSSRMANLLNSSFDSKRENREKVSRASLLSELAARGVVSCASQEVQDLYNLMEHEFLPLDLASKVQPLFSKISTIGGKLSSAPSVPEIQLSQYQPALEKLTTLRVLQQASRVFQSMRIDTLSRMIPFFDFNVVEKIAVDAVKHNFVAMKVDHLSGAVRFSNTEIESDVFGASHLIGALADSLNKAVHKPSEVGSLAGVVEKEHQRLLARKSIIEKRKEDYERQILEKEKAEEAKRLSIQKKSADEERERLLKDRRLREQQRIRQEIEDRAQREIGKTEQKVTKQGAMELVSHYLAYRMSRQGMEKRLEKLAKRMDHLERARRQEEAPLIEEAFRRRVEEEKVLHEQEQLRENEISEQRHAGDLLEKKRLSRFLEHKNAFQERVVQRREAEFLSLTKEREERISQLVSSRRRERETARKLTYYLKMEEQRIQRAREEEEQRIQRAREEEEQRIQRAREEEEQREEEERERREEAPPARSNQPWRRRSGPSANSSSSGSWRH
ncbi:unnamed protein product [Triticum turgidum subsp. durum]|uniref:PCI domain-containing protein n=1 Tax=Triticum turgidum subsp. durum TaxID=4567 RepID=A0A9R0TFD5_TRITD|nr:unnamed protein product [Triticum turgidum subsp. durum]